MANVKKFTRKQIKEGKGKDTVFIIDNVVYDVTKFLDEHPGGHEVLQNVAGTDASEAFDDIGHSLDAKDLMKKFVVGQVVDEDRVQLKKKNVSWDNDSSNEASDSSFLSSWKFPVLVGVLLTLAYTFLFG